MGLHLEWLAWYVARCAAGEELDAETHRLAAEKIADAIERKRRAARRRAATYRRKRQAAGRPEPKPKPIPRMAWAP